MISILVGSLTNTWSEEAQLYDGYIEGQSIEFKTLSAPSKKIQYLGILNDAMNKISGTFEGISGINVTGKFTATKN